MKPQLIPDEGADRPFVIRPDRKADFAALAREYSLVQQTAANGGEIGWLTENMKGVDKEFMDAFNKKVDEVYMFKNAQGIQIVQVMEKTAPRKKVKLAILERKVTASSRTQARIYNEAKQFASAVKDAESFQAKADELGLSVRPANNLDKNAERVSIVPQSRQVVRWAFGEDANTVSDVFDCGDQFVVAVVTEVNEKGYTPVAKVSGQIKAELMKEKKAERMIADLQAKLTEGKSLEELAKALDVDVKEATGVSFASYSFGSAGFGQHQFPGQSIPEGSPSLPRGQPLRAGAAKLCAGPVRLPESQAIRNHQAGTQRH